MDHLQIGLVRSQALEGQTLGRGVREEGRRAVAEASLSPFLILEHCLEMVFQERAKE